MRVKHLPHAAFSDAFDENPFVVDYAAGVKEAVLRCFYL